MTIVRRSLIQLAISVCLVALGFVSDVSGQRFFRATLDGTQEVPPTATTAAGTGYVILNAAETQISYRLEFTGLGSNQTAAHIHGPAARGVNAGVLFSIGSSGTTSGVFSAENIAVTVGQVADLKNGLFYFNVHSTGFPGGEIRGQIEPDCAQMNGNPISWWPGEGNAFDIMSGNNGTLQNGATFAAGLVGRAFSFDGNDDRVVVPHNASLDPPSGNITLEAWVFATNFVGQGSIINKRTVANNDGYTLEHTAGGNLSLAVFVGGTGFFVVSPSGLPLNTWTHVAGTYNGTTLTIYINGVNVGSTNSSGGPVMTTTGDLWIGENIANSTNWNGMIDEPSVYNRSLSQTEIQSIVNAGTRGKCPPCVATPVGLADWWTGDGNLFGVRNRNNGALVPPATFAEGIAGHAFSFTPNSIFDVPDSATLDLTTQFTFDAWINPAALHNGVPRGGVISKVQGGGNGNAYQFGINANNTEIFCQFNALNETWPGNQLVTNIGSGIPLNTWSHIACTYDNNALRIYLNGILVGGPLVVGPKSVVNSPSSLRISGDGNGNVFFEGRIDEPHIFDRALSGSEIASVVNAGRSCFCKPGATTAPANIIGWWGGDGDTSDIAGSNSGTLNNGVGFAITKVGQGFRLDGVDDTVTAPQTTAITSSFTAEAWVSPTTVANAPVIFERGTVVLNRIGLQIQGSGLLSGYFDSGSFTVTGGTIPLNTFTHVAYVFDDAADQQRLYVNGVETAVAAAAGVPSSNSGTLTIGTSPNAPGTNFSGRIDEFSLYNRALSPGEIASISNAGLAGKLKNVVTPIGFADASKNGGDAIVMERVKDAESVKSPEGTAITVGDVTISMSVTTAGITQQIPLSLAGLPPFPNQSTGLTYDISTTAVYVGQPTVCFNLPSFTPAQFSNLRILHLENGSWVNRTNLSSIYDDLCTTALPSLSPFAIVNLAPSAANVSVSGRILTSNGHGVSRARVTMTDPDGVTRTAVTGSFGYYRFDEVEVGRTYVVSIGSKRYTFTPRVINVTDELIDLDFVAIE